MRRTALLVGAWLLGGAAAVGAASLGVSMVGDQVTGDRPTPLSAAEVRDELDAVPATASTTTVTATATTPTTATPADPGTSATTTGPPVASTATTTATTAAPPPPTAPVETRTYPLVGGTATLRFTPSGVTVVAATPNPGFSVDTSPEHGNGVRVEFDGDEHRSRVTGWWEDGPRDEVREED